MNRSMLRMMMMGLSLVLCAHAWSLPQGVRGGNSGEVLRWKWAEGQVLRYRTTQELSWAMDGAGIGAGLGGGLGGGGQKQETKNEWLIVYEIKQAVTRVDAEGIATVEQTYESAKINASDAEESVRYNSKNRADEKKKDHRLVKPFAAFVGKTITFTVGPEGKVHSLDGASKILDEALSATGDANPLMMGITAMFRASLSDESMRKGLESQLRIVPDKAVNRGDTWSVTSDQSLPLVGTLATEVQYKLDRFKRASRRGGGGSIAMIKVAGEIKQKNAGGGGGLAAALSLAKLSESSVKGNIDFNVSDGRIDKSSLDIAMTFKIGLGEGMEMGYTMKQRGDMELLSAK